MFIFFKLLRNVNNISFYNNIYLFTLVKCKALCFLYSLFILLCIYKYLGNLITFGSLFIYRWIYCGIVSFCFERVYTCVFTIIHLLFRFNYQSYTCIRNWFHLKIFTIHDVCVVVIFPYMYLGTMLMTFWCAAVYQSDIRSVSIIIIKYQ